MITLRPGHKLSQGGRERVADDDRSGRFSTSKTDENVLQMKNLLNNDHRMGIRMIADDFSIHPTQVCEILTENLTNQEIIREAKGLNLLYYVRRTSTFWTM